MPASAEASRQQLDGLRAALDATTQALESTLRPSSKLERDIARLADDSTAAATVAAEQAAKQVSDAAQVVHDDLSSQLQTRTKEKEALLILLKDTQAQNDSLRHHLTDAEQRAAAATGDLGEAHAADSKS